MFYLWTVRGIHSNCCEFVWLSYKIFWATFQPGPIVSYSKGIFFFFFGEVSFWDVCLPSVPTVPLHIHVPAPTCPHGMSFQKGLPSSMCLIPVNCVWSTKRELFFPSLCPCSPWPFFLSVMQPGVSLTDLGWARCDRLPLCYKHKHLKHFNCIATCQCMQLKELLE